MTELKRTLGLSQCVFFGVGSILGAGIYTLLGKVAGLAGNLTWLSFAIASLTAFCTACSYAELSSALPRAGGEYVYVTKAFGKKLGTIIGLIIALNGIISGATVSLGFAGYFGRLFQAQELLAALGIIVAIFLVNVSGIRQSSALNIVFTLIEAAGLLFVIYVALPYIGSVNYFDFSGTSMYQVFTAAALGFFAYIGFEEIVKLAEEAKKPERHIPRALFVANLIVAILYIAVAICAISVVSAEELGASNSPMSSIVGGSYGKSAVTAISIIALFSTSNTILSNMIGSSRVLLEMSREISWLKRFSYVSAKRQTPVAALAVILVIMALFASIGEIETIARIATIFIFTTFLVVNLSAIRLRKKMPDLVRPFYMPLNAGKVPIISVFAIFLTLLLLGFNILALVKGG